MESKEAMGMSMLAKLWSRAYTLDVMLRWTVFLGHVFILLIKSFSMLLSLFEGILDYISLPSVVCLDGSEVSNKEVNPWTINPSLNEGLAERKQAAPCPVGYGVSRSLGCSWWWWVCNFFSGQHFLFPTTIPASLVAQMVKNLPAMQDSQVPSLGKEDPLEQG